MEGDTSSSPRARITARGAGREAREVRSRVCDADGTPPKARGFGEQGTAPRFYDLPRPPMAPPVQIGSNQPR
jgi:hypothetical protein